MLRQLTPVLYCYTQNHLYAIILTFACFAPHHELPHGKVPDHEPKAPQKPATSFMEGGALLHQAHEVRGHEEAGARPAIYGHDYDIKDCAAESRTT